MFTETVKAPVRRRPGRPSGPTADGLRTRRRLYDAAVELITERGYDEATLRDVAGAAGVSVGLLYKYFPSKRAVVLALYDELSADYAREAVTMTRGRWRERYVFALRTSLRVLGPHRRALSRLVPVLVGDPEDGVFGPSTAFSRERVVPVFDAAIREASDAPKADLAAPLGRLLYLIHLAVLLWWVLDKSPRQRATAALVALIERALPLASLALRVGPVRSIVRSGDALFREALFDNAEISSGSRP